MRAIREFDMIRLTVPLEGPEVFTGRIYPLPAGTEGAVVDMLGNQGAYEVEFLLSPDQAGPDSFISVQIPVEAYQCELVEEK